MLQVPDGAIVQLQAFRLEPKFIGEPDGMYTGVQDETLRLGAETVVNELIGNIQAGLKATPTAAFVLNQFAVALLQLTLFDTEDREQACAYLERIMDCVGLESSNGLLNNWLYGFDPEDLGPKPAADTLS